MKALRGVHTKATNELRELASRYALDAMSQEEKAAYEGHLASGCSVCTAEVASYRDVTGAIALSVEPVAPRSELRTRLMTFVAETSHTTARPSPGVLYDKDGVLVARHSEMEWQAGGLPGIFRKVLFDDARRGFTTAMVRMTAGTHYPSHRHAGVEELYLLEGDLLVGDVPMRPGDYCRGEAGSIHAEIFTNGGCLFMVTSSHHDEILA